MTTLTVTASSLDLACDTCGEFAHVECAHRRCAVEVSRRRAPQYLPVEALLPLGVGRPVIGEFAHWDPTSRCQDLSPNVGHVHIVGPFKPADVRRLVRVYNLLYCVSTAPCRSSDLVASLPDLRPLGIMARTMRANRSI